MLTKLVDNSRTDKNTLHSYLPLYDELLKRKKISAKNVLEIGIFQGGSIKLWSDYFLNANIYAVDIIEDIHVWDKIKNKKNIVLYTSTDAYNEEVFNKNFKDIKFDFIIDDGPHTLESMIQFIKLYSQVITDDGILIIEDIQEWDWIEVLKKEVPENLNKFIQVFDLRTKKDRYDDIVFVINKLNY